MTDWSLALFLDHLPSRHGCQSTTMHVLPVLLSLLCLTACGDGGKVLVWPCEFSHWLNMKTILDDLVDRGHTVTIITHTATPSVATKSSKFNFEILPVPFTQEDLNKHFDEMLRYWMYDIAEDSFLGASLKIKEMLDKGAEQNKVVCRALFSNKGLMEKLKQEHYEVMLIDPMWMCGDLLAQTLDVPFILTLRFTFGSAMERQCGQLPTPPSYVPGIGFEYTDQMDFAQRLKNFLFYLSQDILLHVMVKIKWDPFYTELAGEFQNIDNAQHNVKTLKTKLHFSHISHDPLHKTGKTYLWPHMPFYQTLATPRSA